MSKQKKLPTNNTPVIDSAGELSEPSLASTPATVNTMPASDATVAAAAEPIESHPLAEQAPLPQSASEPMSNHESSVAVKHYDLKAQHNVTPERLTALEIVNERFARQFRIGIFNLLRKNTDVLVNPLTVQTFKAFSASNNAISHLNLVHLSPLRGASLFSFSPELIFMLVENLFGGESSFAEANFTNREFTHTEHNIIKRVLQIALTNYKTSWSGIYAIEPEYVRSELQSKFANITSSPDDLVITSTFSIEVGQSKGNFSLCIPYAMIEPIKDRLASPPLDAQADQDNEVWRHSLTSGIKHSTVELVSHFGTINTTVKQILALNIDDILLIDSPIKIKAMVDGVPVLTANYGKTKKHYAIQVEQIITSVLEQLNKESSL